MPRLQENQSIVDELALMAFPLRQIAHSEQKASEDAGLPPDGSFGSMKPVLGYVCDRRPDRFQHFLC